jgi:hypothetical protein
MGLLYVFPVSLEEKDFVELRDEKITLKTYGLPYLFWGYALAILMIITFMFLAIKAPVLKLIELGDETDTMLGYSFLAFLGSLPVFILAFFFFEKRIIKEGQSLTLEYRFFGLKLFSETFTLAEMNPFSIGPYLSSPNMARIKGSSDSTGFQNKGYFVLWLNTREGKQINIDRHSRKVDLEKLEELLRQTT